jgi:1,4-dihydroxy-2-naphthoyl-CoA hydrolase
VGTVTAELDALVALMPFATELGLVLVEASAERVVARLDWAPRLCTAGGILHGGVLMSLADSAGALVTSLGLPDGAITATATSTTQLARPVSRGTVRAMAVPLHRGADRGHRPDQRVRRPGAAGRADDPGPDGALTRRTGASAGQE